MDYLRLAAIALKEHEAKRHRDSAVEAVLKGTAIALYCDSLNQTLWLVADEEDAQLLGERRGIIYTAEEIRLVASIDDPEFVRELHAFKNEFNVAATGGEASEVSGEDHDRTT